MQGEEIIGIIDIAVFAVYLILGIFGALRTGLRQGAWIPVMIVSVIRIAGGGLTIALYTISNPSLELYYWSYSLASIGLALLNVGFIRLLQLFYGTELRQSFRLCQLVNTVGFILGIVGASSQNTLELKIAAALYTAAFLFGLFMLGAGYRSMDRLWYGIALVTPFLAVRIGYSWYSAFVFSLDPNFIIHLILGVIMEIIIVGLLLAVGFMHHETKRSQVGMNNRVGV